MRPCSTYCQFFNQPWANTITIIACVVLSLYGLYACYRVFNEVKKLQEEKRQRVKEKEREWNFIQYRMKSMIRVAEEWCTDATEAKDFLAESQRLMEEAKKIDRLPYKAILPVFLVGILAIIIAPFPQIMSIVLFFLATPALILFLFYGVLWQIKRRIFIAKYLNSRGKINS